MPKVRSGVSPRHDADVAVAGGGPAGVAAAIGAARAGAKVALLEGASCFGGMATSGLVPAAGRLLDLPRKTGKESRR